MVSQYCHLEWFPKVNNNNGSLLLGILSDAWGLRYYVPTGYDPGANEGLLVFNRKVSFKVEVFQEKLTVVNEQAKIDNLREQDAKELEIKEARMKVDPNNLFKLADEYKGQCS
jgi:hypothetical protein